MAWKQWRGDFFGAMKIGRQVMGSAEIKTRAFKGYTPSAHDVFVCTYSKSGTYWMLQIVSQIASKGSAEFDHIHDIVPWPESPFFGIVSLKAQTWQSAPTQLRAIKSHAEAPFIPYNTAAKYLVVMRDPKDVLISAFYFADSIMPGLKSIGMPKWIDTFLIGETPFGAWAEHLASFWPWRKRENVMLFTFGEMKGNLEKAVRAIAAFMQVDLTDAELADVVRKSEFAYMKSVKEKFKPPAPSKDPRGIELLRGGRKGDSAELLTPEQLARVDREMKAQLIALGS
ncbi:MAG: sulfotransferase domain-containing protein, partial [Methylococcales bacterium]|nr:sulfotransferase domain-containing protein [Methylococcales bacterium]